MAIATDPKAAYGTTLSWRAGGGPDLGEPELAGIAREVAALAMRHQ